MQNTVELNALTLSSSVYLNSTTKYVKGLPSSSSPPASQTLLPVTHSPKTQKYSAQQPGGNNHMSQGSHNKSPGVVPRSIGLPSPSKMDERPSSNPLEMAAFNLSANVFMNSTTKFVKGFVDLTPVRQTTSRSPKQKKSLSEGKKKEESPKKNMDPEANPKGRTQKTPEKNAMDMTAVNYMNSTTKYLKSKIDESQMEPPNVKVEKIIKNNTTARSSNEKLGSMLGKGEKSQADKPRADSPQSNSSSGGRIARKKDRDRTRQLKFLQKRQPQESVVTVKDRAASFDFKTRRNDTKIVQQQEKQPSKPQISQLIINSQQYIAPNDAKLPSMNSTTSISQFEAKPPLNRLNRNAVNEIKSADTRAVEKKEETGKPFARQPQNARPQLIQKTANQPPKIPNTLHSGQLPLETPIKTNIQSSKQIDQQANLLKVKPQQATQHQISVIREERSSLVQNTKTSINNKKSYHGSTKEDLASQASLAQTHIQPNKLNQNSKFARTASSANQEKIQSVKEVPMDVRTTTPSLLEERKSPQGLKPVQSKKAIKTEPEEKGSTTWIQQPTIDVSKSKKNIQNNSNNPTQLVLQNKKSLPSSLENSKPQEQSFRLKTQQEKNVKEVIKTQAARPIQAKIEEGKNIVNETGNKEIKTVKSTRIIQSRLEDTKPKDKEINVKTSYPASRPSKEAQKQIIQIQSVKSIQTRFANSPPSSSPSIKVQQPIQSAKSFGLKQDEAKPASRQENTVPSLAKSYVISQLCSKFYYRLMSQAFSSISAHSQTSKFHSKQGLILSLQTVSTYTNIEKSFLGSCFAQIKRFSSLKLPSRKEINPNVGKEAASGILFRVLGSKQREYFDIIKRNKTFSQSKSLQKKERTQKEKDGKETKGYHLQQLKKIVETLSRNKVQNSFNKILLNSSRQQKKSSIQTNSLQSRSPSKYTRPPKDYQAQKSSLLQTKSQLQTSISAIESRMAEKKRYSDVQKMRMIKKQQEMTQKNKKLDEEIMSKRKNNKELKGQLEALGQKEDLDISLPDYEPLVGLLTDIYSTIFANKEEKVDVASLSRKYDLAKEDRNLLLDQWSSLTRNAQLKTQIAKWQGSDPFCSGHQTQRRQNDTLGSLIRNLIRERYMWQWVKTVAEKVS